LGRYGKALRIVEFTFIEIPLDSIQLVGMPSILSLESGVVGYRVSGKLTVMRH
jgi:hypothetical protein